MIIGTLLMEIIVSSCFHTNIVIIENFRRESMLRLKNRREISSDFAIKRSRISLLEWKQIETVIFSSEITFITMKTIIEYVQLCHIHFYQKIAHKKVARVNAALGLFAGAESEFELVFLRRRQDFLKQGSEFLVEIEYSLHCQALLPITNLSNMSSNRSFYELQQVYYICKKYSSPSLRKPGIVTDKIFKFRPNGINYLVAFYQSNLIAVYSNTASLYYSFFLLSHVLQVSALSNMKMKL